MTKYNFELKYFFSNKSLLLFSILFFLFFSLLIYFFDQINLFNSYYNDGFWVFAPDARTYHNSAISIKDLIKNDLISYSEFFFIDRNHANTKWLALIYIISNSNQPILFQIINLLLWTLSIYFVFRTSIKIFNNRIAAIISCILFFLPSVLFNFFTLLRDPFFIMAISLFFFSVSNINFHKIKYINYFLILISLYFIDEIRSYITFLFYIFLILLPVYKLIFKNISLLYFFINFSLIFITISINFILSIYINYQSNEKFIYNHYQYECVLKNLKNEKILIYDDFKLNIYIRNLFAEKCVSGDIDEKDNLKIREEKIIKYHDKIKHDTQINENHDNTNNNINDKTQSNEYQDNINDNTLTKVKSEINYTPTPQAKSYGNNRLFHDQIKGAAEVVRGKNKILDKINSVRIGFTTSEFKAKTYSNIMELLFDIPNLFIYGFFSPSVIDLFKINFENPFQILLIFDSTINTLAFIFTILFLIKNFNLYLINYILLFVFGIICILSLFIPSEYTLIRIKTSFLIPFYICAAQYIFLRFFKK